VANSPKKNKKSDVWRESWLEQFGKISDEARSAKTIISLQNAVQNHFGAANVLKEEPLQTVIGQNDTNHKLDLFIPSERTAIEICLSAIKNEFEKDILKAMLDGRVTTLYIMARDYITGKNEMHYGFHTMQQPSNSSIINMVQVFKLNVIPTQLCPV
jgi:hypothetical protein